MKMKHLNKKNFTCYEANKFASKTVALMLLSFILMIPDGICQQVSSVQKGNVGLAVSSVFNSDGYGVQYLPSVYYKKNRNTYFAALLIQKQKANVSGIQLNYEYTLVTPDEADAKGLELFCFVAGLYHNNALLGKQALHNESMANPEYVGASQLHFKSVEVYTGFGLRIKLFKNVKWVNSLGAGGYSSFNSPQHLYYENHNMGLYLKTGISIDLKK